MAKKKSTRGGVNVDRGVRVTTASQAISSGTFFKGGGGGGGYAPPAPDVAAYTAKYGYSPDQAQAQALTYEQRSAQQAAAVAAGTLPASALGASEVQRQNTLIAEQRIQREEAAKEETNRIARERQIEQRNASLTISTQQAAPTLGYTAPQEPTIFSIDNTQTTNKQIGYLGVDPNSGQSIYAGTRTQLIGGSEFEKRQGYLTEEPRQFYFGSSGRPSIRSQQKYKSFPEYVESQGGEIKSRNFFKEAPQIIQTGKRLFKEDPEGLILRAGEGAIAGALLQAPGEFIAQKGATFFAGSVVTGAIITGYATANILEGIAKAPTIKESKERTVYGSIELGGAGGGAVGGGAVGRKLGKIYYAKPVEPINKIFAFFGEKPSAPKSPFETAGAAKPVKGTVDITTPSGVSTPRSFTPDTGTQVSPFDTSKVFRSKLPSSERLPKPMSTELVKVPDIMKDFSRDTRRPTPPSVKEPTDFFKDFSRDTRRPTPPSVKEPRDIFKEASRDIFKEPRRPEPPKVREPRDPFKEFRDKFEERPRRPEDKIKEREAKDKLDFFPKAGLPLFPLPKLDFGGGGYGGYGGGRTAGSRQLGYTPSLVGKVFAKRFKVKASKVPLFGLTGLEIRGVVY